MSTLELRKRLLEKIETIEDKELLEEAYRLLSLETENLEVYQLNADQNKAIAEARQQIQNGQFLTGEQADNEIDEWLSE